MKACKVSIILPVYNTSKYLDCCMESLLNQTLDEIEIIAVNDGSTDNSLEILKKYQAANPNKVYVYNTENHGVSHARNFGLEKAAGEYIWFVDSDDFTESNACELLYNKAKKDGNDLVLFSRYDVDNSTGEKRGNKTFHFNQNFKAEDKPYEMVKLSPFPWNKFIRRDLLDGIKFPEGVRFEDLPVSFILFTRAKSIGVINDFLYNYRLQIGFLSRFSSSTLDIVKAIDFLKKTLENDGTDSYYKKELEYVAVRHFLYRFEQLLYLNSNNDYELKIRLVNELFEYLENNYPEFNSNPYLIYNLPDRIYRLIDFYSSKENLLEYILKTKNMTPNEQELFNTELTEKYSPSEKKESSFDIIKEEEEKKSIFFSSKQNDTAIGNSAVLVSNAYKGISSSILSVLLFLKKNYSDTKTALACSEKSADRAKSVLEYYGFNDTIVLIRGTEKYMEYTAAAKYIIADCPLEHYFKKIEGQKYVNLITEHIAPKEIYNRRGRDYNFAAVQKSIITADFSVYLNESSRDAFEKKYKLQGLGVKSLCGICPAADISGVSEIRKELCSDNKKLILLAPQYKTGDDRTPVNAFRKYMASLIIFDREMNDNETAYLCLDSFPFEADMSIFRNIRLLPERYDLFDSISSADIVVTNYHQLLTECKNSGAKIVRYITDEKRYIDNELLEIDEDNFFTCTNPYDLAQYIHGADTAERKCTEENNCSKLFDAINSDTAIRSNAGEEVNVLYFLGGNLTLNRIRRFKSVAKENPIKNYYLAFDEGKNPDYHDELDEYLKKINYIPVRFDSVSCFDDKTVSAICSKGRAPLFGKDKLEHERKSEWSKYFGNIHFDEIVLLSVGEIARNLMFIGAAPQLEYSFSWFSFDKYNSKKAFKCKVDYICKELEAAQKVIIPKEMQGLKAVKNLKQVREAD